MAADDNMKPGVNHSNARAQLASWERKGLDKEGPKARVVTVAVDAMFMQRGVAMNADNRTMSGFVTCGQTAADYQELEQALAAVGVLDEEEVDDIGTCLRGAIADNVQQVKYMAIVMSCTDAV